jgi:hypothetical protein
MNNTNTQKTLPALRGNLADLPLTPGKALALQNIGNAFSLAELVVKAGFAPKGSSVESSVVAMIHGAKLGLDPLAAVQGIAVVNGRPTLWGDQLAAAVKGSSVFGGERVEYLGSGDDAGCRVTVWRKGEEDNPTTEVFTVRDAKRAGLWGKSGPWTQYPRQMLFNRARAFAYRHAFPDALMGMRFREEEEDVARADGPRPVGTPQTIGGVPADEARDEARKARKPRASKLRAALDIPAEDAVEVTDEPAPAPEPVFAPGGETPATAPETRENAPDASDADKSTPDGPEAR